MIRLYGIKNCDTVKKAQHFLNQAQLPFQFHDFRIEGLTAELLQGWLKTTPWESLLNKRSTSWRNLPQEHKSDLNAEKVFQLLLDNPTLIKRPVLDMDGRIHVGFKAETYQALINE